MSKDTSVDNDRQAVITIRRIQDGESHTDRYHGNIREIGTGHYVAFSERQEDDSVTSHLLKVRQDGMDWVRIVNGKKSSMVFEKGQRRDFKFYTPVGSLDLTVVTHSYSYTEKGTHEIRLSYSIAERENHISDYETVIIIKVV